MRLREGPDCYRVPREPDITLSALAAVTSLIVVGGENP